MQRLAQDRSTLQSNLNIHPLMKFYLLLLRKLILINKLEVPLTVQIILQLGKVNVDLTQVCVLSLVMLIY
jgi:hypothetical protein